MKTVTIRKKNPLKRRDPMARTVLTDPAFRKKRVVDSKKIYTRKEKFKGDAE